MKPWCKGFGIDVEVILFLSDDEYLAFHKELDQQNFFNSDDLFKQIISAIGNGWKI